MASPAGDTVRQRTALLKSASGARFRGDRGALDTLDVWDGHLAAHGAELMAARMTLGNELALEVQKSYQRLAPASRPTSISYHASVDVEPDRPDVELLRTALLEKMAARRDAELERGVCLVGPHRDDLELRLGEAGVDACGVAAHVPHYLAQATFPAASVALLEHAQRLTGLHLPAESLQEAAEANRTDIDEQIARSPENTAEVTNSRARSVLT